VFNLGEEGQAVLRIIFHLFPVVFYIMGLMEGKKGHYLFLMGIATHLLVIITRGFALGTFPLTEKHDTISFMGFALACSYWYVGYRKGLSALGVMALPLISAIMVISFGHAPINTISPFLKTPWFTIHTFLYFTSYGLFGMSFCLGLFYFFNNRDDYESLQYKSIIYGWILFSVSLVTASIWFFLAHGTYWLWTSRELWVTLTWLYYGLYLHARLLKGLRGRPASVMGTLGFLVALFAYFGLGTVIPSPPTQF
jgi:ABC-type transport system involved in cytochrome c biogenesis permease subunit